MSFAAVSLRQMWLSQTALKEHQKAPLLNAPLCPSSLFGPPLQAAIKEQMNRSVARNQPQTQFALARSAGGMTSASVVRGMMAYVPHRALPAPPVTNPNPVSRVTQKQILQRILNSSSIAPNILYLHTTTALHQSQHLRVLGCGMRSSSIEIPRQRARTLLPAWGGVFLFVCEAFPIKMTPSLLLKSKFQCTSPPLH